MVDALFQHIPRGLFEPVAFLGFLGLVLFLIRRWSVCRSEAALLGGSVLFMIGWRVAQPIRADRYGLMLLPIALYFTMYLLQELAQVCRKGGWRLTYHLLAVILLLGCLCKSYHSESGDRPLFEMVHLLKQQMAMTPGPVTLVSERDLSYFLGERCAVVAFYLQSSYQMRELPPGDFYLLKVEPKRGPLDPENEEFTLLKKIRPSGESFDFILLKRGKGV